MIAIRLQTNYRTEPFGMDDKSLRFSWNCEGGTTQTAYQIVTDDWDSGKVSSAQMHAIGTILYNNYIQKYLNDVQQLTE